MDLRDFHRNMASIFSLNGYILLYVVTLKLHYFTKDDFRSAGLILVYPT